MKSRKKVILGGFALCLAVLAIVLVPFSGADVRIKIYQDQKADFSNFSMYYTTVTDQNLSEKQHIFASHISAEDPADYEEIFFGGKEYGELTGLRLDVDAVPNYLAIDRVEICSGGVIQKSYTGSEFFGNGRVLVQNDISDIQLTISAANILPSGEDPFIMFSPEFVEELKHAQSHYRLTLAIGVLLAAAALWIAREKWFPAD